MEKRTEKLKSGLACFDIDLSEETLLRQIVFLDELIRWSQRINLTAIRNLEEGIEKHLVDSLVLLSYINGHSLLDIGTGAGLPAIPLAIAVPDIHITSVESVGKKINFQNHIRRFFKLENLMPIHSRVEELSYAKKYPVITARAFAPIAKILELVQPILSPGGELLLLRGAMDEVPLLQTDEALCRFGFKVNAQHSYRLPFSGSQRQILKISRNTI